MIKDRNGVAGATTRTVFAMTCLVLLAMSAFGATAVRLRCEYRENPLGIDVAAPRLSWGLESDFRGERQTAYRILVATSPEALAEDKGDLWDSGKVVSAQSVQAPYAGKPLDSHRVCHWKVRVWDKDGRPSAWSQPARWCTGFMDESDWQARWIARQEAPGASAQGCKWIWFPEGEPQAAAPPGTRYFRKTVVLPQGVVVRKAEMVVSADNRFTLHFNGALVGGGKDYQSLERFDLTGRLVAGLNVIAVAARNDTDAPNPAGLVAKLTIDHGEDARETIQTEASWRTSQTAMEGWEGTEFDDSAWVQAIELGEMGMAPWGMLHSAPGPLPMFRKGFSVDRPVTRAVAYVCGLGQYEMRLNGAKVGDHVMDPGWTNYRKRCLYATYDVTDAIRQGPNCLGMLLGNGMYNVPGGRYVKFTGSFGPPKVIAHLRLEFADGTTDTIVTDDTWRADQSATVFSCIFGGEDYDARTEQPGWDEPGFDDTAWAAARVVNGPGGRLVSQDAPPIKVMERFDTVAVTEPQDGVYIYDLGQNFSGWPVLTVRGNRGAVVKLTPGELLDDQGLVTQRSSGGPTFFTYTLKGGGTETWRPRFSYYGFRYVQVEGAAPDSAELDTPVVESLHGEFTHSSASRVGHFSCSSTLINRIHDLILAAVRSNLQSVLTDCPHREKLGWLEVSQLLGPAIFFNFDAPMLYTKIVQDTRESQLENGFVPDIAPEYVVFNGGFRDSPEWGSASVINPWHLYQWYGDAAILDRHYDVMKQYVEYLACRSDGHIVSHGLGDWCDIGPRGPGPSQLTPLALTATATYYQDVCIVRDTARLLGRDDDAALYSARAREIYEAFNQEFFDADTNQYATGSQTSQAMPLVLGLVDDDRRPPVLDQLVADVHAHGDHVTSGDVGFRYLVTALLEGGRSDVVYAMTAHTEPPSYGDQLAQGATALAETWDANPAASQNHCMLGHVEEWFYRGLGGIGPDPSGVGFEKIRIAPQVVGDITWVKCTYESIRGPLAVHWRVEPDGFHLDVTVPGNATATVHVPTTDAADVLEGGVPAVDADGVRFLGVEAGAAVYDVGSGEYAFLAPKGG